MLEGDQMKKLTILMLAMAILSSPAMMVSANDSTQGDDLLETVFKGTVTDITNGEPIEDVYVYGFDDGYNERKFDVTDENGHYYLEFKKGGTYFIFADHDDYHQGDATENVDVNEETVIDFELEPRVYNTRIFGIVTDSETGDPLDEAVVSLGFVVQTPMGWRINRINSTISDNDGSYSFDISEGNYSLDVYKEGYNSESTRPFFVESGENFEKNIELDKWSQGVFGIVTNRDGEPMADITVSLEGDRMRGNDVTDENGYYKIRVIKGGQFTLKAHEDGYRPYIMPLNIHEDEMKEVDISMVESHLPSPILRIVYLILSLLGGI
jgi:hypothetical protein